MFGSRLPTVEALVAGGIAIIVEAVNYSLFSNSRLGVLLALQTAFLGVLLSLQRAAIQSEYASQHAPLVRLANFIDIQADADYADLRGFNQRYASIIEPEFRVVKEQIVADATERVRKLAINKRSSTLQTAEYYDWLFKQFESLEAGQYVHAVSLSTDEEWNESQLEKNFFSVNLAAAQRGVLITRIFVIETKRVSKFIQLPHIQAHLPGSNTGLAGLMVSLEELKRFDQRLLGSIGQGFIDFNGHVGLEDYFDSHGQARGEVTMLPDDLVKMASTYKRLMNMSKALS